MKCPCCNLTLKADAGQLVSCGNVHKFEVTLDNHTLRRVLVLQNDPPEKCGCKQGDRFPVNDDVAFD